MKKITLLMVAMVASVAAMMAQYRAAGDKFVYNGHLKVEMGGMAVADDDGKVITLTEEKNGKYTFLLEDLTVMGGAMKIGDVKLENVTREDANGDGTAEIKGSADDMALMNGAIHAKVTVSGREDVKSGDLNLDLNIIWYQAYPSTDTKTPITGSFVGKRVEGGVGNVVAKDANIYGAAGAIVVNGYAGRVEIYGVDGRLAKTTIVDGNAEIAMPAGLYVVRAGVKSQKVAVE